MGQAMPVFAAAGINISPLVVQDLLVEVDPELEDEPDGAIEALAAQVGPALALTAEAFRQVAGVRDGEAVFRRFIENMLAAAG